MLTTTTRGPEPVCVHACYVRCCLGFLDALFPARNSTAPTYPFAGVPGAWDYTVGVPTAPEGSLSLAVKPEKLVAIPSRS